MTDKPINLKEIPFGTPVDDPDGYCIYCLGHIDPRKFLEAVRAMAGGDVPLDARSALEIADVEHIRFRPMSPSEARAAGLTHGVYQTTAGGYAVTAVKV